MLNNGLGSESLAVRYCKQEVLVLVLSKRSDTMGLKAAISLENDVEIDMLAEERYSQRETVVRMV